MGKVYESLFTTFCADDADDIGFVNDKTFHVLEQKKSRTYFRNKSYEIAEKLACVTLHHFTLAGPAKRLAGRPTSNEVNFANSLSGRLQDQRRRQLPNIAFFDVRSFKIADGIADSGFKAPLELA